MNKEFWVRIEKIWRQVVSESDKEKCIVDAKSNAEEMIGKKPIKDIWDMVQNGEVGEDDDDFQWCSKS